LFSYIKGKFRGTEFTERDDLLAEVGEILNGISGKVLKVVFIEWEKRLKKCIDARNRHIGHVIIDTITDVQQPGRRVDANFRQNTLYKV
jgi:hypothetical protein